MRRNRKQDLKGKLRQLKLRDNANPPVLFRRMVDRSSRMKNEIIHRSCLSAFFYKICSGKEDLQQAQGLGDSRTSSMQRQVR